MSAPKIYSSSLRNRHDRQAPPAPPPPPIGSLLFAAATNPCTAPTINQPALNPGTLEIWIRPTSPGGYLCGTMFNNQYCGAALFATNTHLYSRLNHDGHLLNAGIPTPTPNNAWTHVAITWQTNLVTLWINGQNVQTGSDPNYTYIPHDNYHVGGKFAPAYAPLQAYVTLNRLSNITRYTTNFTPAKDFTADVNTIALYRMTEASGTTVADESTNTNTLIFPGANLPTWSDKAP